MFHHLDDLIIKFIVLLYSITCKVLVSEQSRDTLLVLQLCIFFLIIDSSSFVCIDKTFLDRIPSNTNLI